MTSRIKKKLFGISFSDLTQNAIVEDIISNKYENTVIVTPNVDHVVRFHKDENFQETYKCADIVINDSRIIKILSKLTNSPLTNVVPGSDITRLIFQQYHCIQDNHFCVIGATKEDLVKISGKYEITNMFQYIPPYGFIESEEEIQNCIDFCKNLPKCIYFLAVGSPQQEVLANRLKNANINGTFLCVGASLLFLSGAEKRAPRAIQLMHLEWLYRLIQSPKRLWKRYLIDGPFIFFIVFKEVFASRKSRS